MSRVWGMILQWGSTINVSIELPVATRHRRDITEKILKATLNPNKQQLQNRTPISAHSKTRLKVQWTFCDRSPRWCCLFYQNTDLPYDYKTPICHTGHLLCQDFVVVKETNYTIKIRNCIPDKYLKSMYFISYYPYCNNLGYLTTIHSLRMNEEHLRLEKNEFPGFVLGCFVVFLVKLCFLKPKSLFSEIYQNLHSYTWMSTFSSLLVDDSSFPEDIISSVSSAPLLTLVIRC